MPLIQVAAPKNSPTGMADTLIVRPGGNPPLVSPHCRVCRVPVEAFEIDPVSSWYYLGIEATCHGKTQGIRVPAEKAIRDGMVWMF